MEQQGLSPRARAKRDQLRTGAQRVSREGVAGISVDAIAYEAGVSKQTLYVYYAGKEKLFADVLGHLIHEKPQNRLPVMDGGVLETPDEVRQALNFLTRRLIAGFMQPAYLALIRVVIAESPRLPQLGSLLRSAVPERALGNISTILERAQQGGVIEAVNKEAATRMFTGALLTYAMLDGLLVGDGPTRSPALERI